MFVLDNAAYHHSEETLLVFHKLGIKVIFSGPYSFSSAPIETFFGHLKVGELNPQK